MKFISGILAGNIVSTLWWLFGINPYPYLNHDPNFILIPAVITSVALLIISLVQIYEGWHK